MRGKCFSLRQTIHSQHLKMKTYLIIGASTGIGNALAKQLAAAGHHVIGTYHHTSPESIENVDFQPLDVLSAGLESLKIPAALHGLAYCPGSIQLKPFERIKPESFEEDYRFQVTAAIRIIQQSIPLLKTSKEGSVVLFSTIAVQTGFSFHAQVAASKGAIEGLTRALAAEYAPDIRFNAIAPSLTQTPLAAKILNNEDRIEANNQRHPMKRIGQAEDIAQAAAFLLTSASSWITGQILHVDGGLSTLQK